MGRASNAWGAGDDILYTSDEEGPIDDGADSETEAQTALPDVTAIEDTLYYLANATYREARPNAWDEGLSPAKLFCFYHSTGGRHHLAASEGARDFVCGIERTVHKRGGSHASMAGTGLCHQCVNRAQADGMLTSMSALTRAATEAPNCNVPRSAPAFAGAMHVLLHDDTVLTFFESGSPFRSRQLALAPPRFAPPSSRSH